MKVLLLVLRSIDQMYSVIETMVEITKHGKCGVPSASAVDSGHIVDCIQLQRRRTQLKRCNVGSISSKLCLNIN